MTVTRWDGGYRRCKDVIIIHWLNISQECAKGDGEESAHFRL